MSGWRAEDEALLRRLDDEAGLEALWRAMGGVASPPAPRAAGLLAELRALPEAAAHVTRAIAGDGAALARWLAEVPVCELSPAAAHHLALLEERRALGASGREARRARRRALAAWMRVAAGAPYLETLASRVMEDARREEDRRRAAAEAGLAPIGRLRELARRGSRTLDESSREAMALLAWAEGAAAEAGTTESLRRQIGERASRARREALDEALSMLEDEVNEARARGASVAELSALLERGERIWRWADEDEMVVRALIELLTPICWDRYRERRYEDVDRLVRVISAPVDHFAAQIAGDNSRVAYAAPCAQMLVFRAEGEKRLDAQLTLAERALGLCPTHRNGRLVMADLLVSRALRTIGEAMPWSMAEARERAAEDIGRAEALFPQLERLADAKARLRAFGGSA